MMRKKFKIIFAILLAIAVLFFGAQLFLSSNLVVLNPKGEIGEKQKELFNLVSLLMLIVVIPAFILATFFAWKYRVSKKAKYSPDWDRGFSGVTFTAEATTEAQFQDWVSSLQKSPHLLTLDAYNNLAKPSENDPQTTYVLKEEGLFEKIIDTFMKPPLKSEQ